jgi:hypothetical protein
MPPFQWPIDALQLIRDFETRHNAPDAGALFAWGKWAVDSLHYLDDLDQLYDSSRKPISGHEPAVVDVAHARWATSTCITGIDLCAAGLGRVFCKNSGKHELSVAAFNPGAYYADMLRAWLPAVALKWIDAVRSDVNYKKIKQARRWLTHSRLTRHFTLAVGDRQPSRLELKVGKNKLGIRPLIELARDVATKHVISFLKELPNL